MKIRFFHPIKNNTERNLSVFIFFGIYHLYGLSKLHSNWINGIFIKTRANKWWTKTIIIFKNLGASLCAKLVHGTKSCLEATEYSCKCKITNDTSFNVNFIGKCTKGTSMLQKNQWELGNDKTFSLCKQEIFQKNPLKNALPGNNTKLVFPQSILSACQFFLFFPTQNRHLQK